MFVLTKANCPAIVPTIFGFPGTRKGGGKGGRGR